MEPTMIQLVLIWLMEMELVMMEVRADAGEAKQGWDRISPATFYHTLVRSVNLFHFCPNALFTQTRCCVPDHSVLSLSGVFSFIFRSV